MTKVESVSKEILKPLNNPGHPKTHSMSLFDQIAPRYYIPVIFFYRTAGRRPPQLKDSLAATLGDFYPLAGRIRGGSSGSPTIFVDCNDEGALFLEAHVGCSLTEFMINSKNASGSHESPIKPLVPQGFGLWDSYLDDDTSGSIPLAVQLTSFGCGGKAVCVSIAHCVMDMVGVSYFIRTWAARAAHGTLLSASPDFNRLQALYPPSADDLHMHFFVPDIAERPVCTRIVFDYPMVELLKLSASSEEVPNPTTVEAVTGLIHLAVLKAAACRKDLIQAVNLRGRVSPPLPESAMGNLVSFYVVMGSGKEEAMLSGVVSEMRRERGKFFDVVQAQDRDQLRSSTLEMIAGMREEGADHPPGRVTKHLVVTSWCGFGLYEMDFGWGDPVWVTPGPGDKVNVCHLVDKRGGTDGRRWIEADITLEEAEMTVFLKSQKLLSFGYVNPNPFKQMVKCMP